MADFAKLFANLAEDLLAYTVIFRSDKMFVCFLKRGLVGINVVGLGMSSGKRIAIPGRRVTACLFRPVARWVQGERAAQRRQYDINTL